MEVTVVDPYGTNPGPIDCSVLYDQEKHVSSAVWDGQERGALRCHEHTSKLDQWTLTRKQIELVDKAGFGFLRLIPAISLDNPLISALVERWRRETNTFHLNVGEMTVTLKDVALLLGLSIDGEPVIGTTYTTCHSVCEKYLGKAPESGYTSGGMVKLSWLKEFFSRCPENAPFEVIERHTRAYLLYLVGSTIFSTTTGNKVPVMYLPLFEKFDQCGKYAWGAAALAFLYRALGNASLRSQSTISGCLTLLQCWSYFHLNIGRPKLHHEPTHDRFPFVLRWKGKQSGPTANRDVVFYRKALDSLKPCDVEWLPYRNMDSTLIPEDIKSNLILGRSKTMLICFDKAERHLPNRCLRQYGMLQSIPEDVQRWERKSRGVDGGVDLSGKMESELNEWSERRFHTVEGDDGADESDYLQWYLKVTRKFVGRPISLSSEFQRTNAGLRDIAHIADTFSTKGLDPQQIELISRIRYIAHECLRDQVGGPAIVTSTPQQVEVGKRVRGKERVRRKSTGKRLRKDEQTQYNAASEDDQSHFGVTVAIDHLQLHQADREENRSHLCTFDSEENPLEIIHADGEDHMQLCNAHIGIDSSELNHAAVAVPDAEMNHASAKDDDTQFLNETENGNDSRPCDATNEIKASQLSVATLKVDPQLTHAPKEVHSRLSDVRKELDSQLPDATKEVAEPQVNNNTIVVSQLSDTTKEVIDSKLNNTNKEVVDSQQSDATEVIDSQQSDATKELPAAVNKVSDSQISRVTSESGPETAKGNAAADVVQQSSLETSMDRVQQQNAVAS
ncbi:Aminotransferase-like mobile domain containing protein [Parasponia andersonii]|uniref:Aminotransferase-like mobile domain containing protein n=1 Tax=Parasponia andersonii TaxID=3476 RepID=A0A2P5D7Z5_PARAD|nr:Aminotransferase-like mobile domain containing protein [Parasponia andersonii]